MTYFAFRIKKANSTFFYIKNCNYLSQAYIKDVQATRRSRQPSKQNIQHFQTWNFSIFFVGHFFPFRSGSGSIWPKSMRIRVRIRKLFQKYCLQTRSGLRQVKNDVLRISLWCKFDQNNSKIFWTQFYFQFSIIKAWLRMWMHPKRYSGFVTFWYWSGSADPLHGLTDPDPDPALFVSDL